MRRVLYLGYFIKNTKYHELVEDFKRTRKEESLTYRKLFCDMFSCSFKYKSSFHDYFLYQFYNKAKKDRASYLTTGKLHEFYSGMNDKDEIYKFVNKAKFNEVFKDFVLRDFIFIEDSTLDKFNDWITGKVYIIAKPNEGVTGKGIEKILVEEYDSITELYEYLKSNKLNLIEECIRQHADINKINPSSVNTIRIVTVREQNKTDIISAVLRIGVGNHVDNFSAGGIAAPINIKTGLVYKPAISKNNKSKSDYHPKTKAKINGFNIPYWEETIKMVTELSKVIPEVKTVGWDIAITPNGPEVVEGNNNWDKDLFQLPYNKGRKYLIDKYIHN